MPKLNSGMAVIEGKWNSKTNISVKALFDILSDINFNTPHAYVYEMFCDSGSLSNIVSRMGKDSNIRYLYVGAHGTDNAIHCSGGRVTRTQLKNSLSNLSDGAIQGLFLGSCLFGHAENGNFLLNPPDGKPPIKWVAGYQESVDWIDSSALDLLFWNTFFELRKMPPVERIKETAKRIREKAGGLVDELGFSIYARRKGPRGGIRNLLDNR